MTEEHEWTAGAQPCAHSLSVSTRATAGLNSSALTSPHFGNFIECVRSRKAEDLNAPIREGHISCALVHLANASYRLGRTLRFNPDTGRVIGDEEADNLLRDGNRGYRAPFAVPEEV
jgi:Oxidoreductase family, C-terminal alpha/beta domain